MSVLFVLIPLLPLLACLVLAVSGRRIGEASHRIAIPAVAASFALSLVAFVDVLREGPRTIELYRLLQTGALVVDFGLFVDQLAVLLLLLVTGVSAIVQVYSSRYMIGDPRYQRFFAVIALFTSAMVALVMSRNLLLTYMCWEAMGICSYLLISHWAHRPAAGRAAMKAFLVNAVADLGLGCAVLLTFQVYGTLDIPTILDRAGRAAGETVNVLGWTGLEWAVPATTVIPLLLLVAAMGKSAQVPLHVWLPFAMEAPTPVSALIHAATMVNAGPFLLVRFSPMLVLAPFAMTVIAIVGATTAIFAALVALTQTDIKKILAYSTMSHIGFMVMTCGVGAFAAAVFHLLAHGFLKAFLFLSAGNSLQSTAARPGHAAHAAADTAAPFRPLAWGALLLACIPPAILFSGPYEALWTLHGAPSAQWTFWAVALAAVFFTAWYLLRLIHRSFSESFSLPGVTVRPRLFSLPYSLIVAGGGARGGGVLLWVPVLVRRVHRPGFGAGQPGRAVCGCRRRAAGRAAIAAAGRGIRLGVRRDAAATTAVGCRGVAKRPVRVVLEQALLRRGLRRFRRAADAAPRPRPGPLDRTRGRRPRAEPGRVGVRSYGAVAVARARGPWPRPGRGQHGDSVDGDGAVAVAGTRGARHSRIGGALVAPGGRGRAIPADAGAAHLAGTPAARRRRARRAPRALLPGHSKGLA